MATDSKVVTREETQHMIESQIEAIGRMMDSNVEGLAVSVTGQSLVAKECTDKVENLQSVRHQHQARAGALEKGSADGEFQGSQCARCSRGR